MGYTPDQAGQARDPIKTGEARATTVLSSSATSDTIELNIIASAITLQPSGDLAATYTVSANGINFATGGSLSSNGLAYYNSTLVSSIQVTWTSGSGYVTILAVP